MAGRGGEQTGPGGPVAGQLVLLVAVYYRINLTDRQIALLFGISKSAVSRVIAHLAHC